MFIMLVHQGIAKSVGDWYYNRAEVKAIDYYNRAEVKAIDCRYPCDKTCHHIM